MKPIMPPGYSKPATRKRLIEELTKGRQQELANASTTEQKRIRKEIYRQVEDRLAKLYRNSGGPGPIFWSD